MPAGRPPKPTALKQLAGNPGKRALPEADARLAPTLPPPPRHLSAEAKREWRRAGKQLLALRLVTALDRAALAGYCTAWAQHVEAAEHLSREPKVMMDRERRTWVVNPWLAIERTALDQMGKFLREFGMSPSSRAKATPAAADRQEDDPAITWMKGAKSS